MDTDPQYRTQDGSAVRIWREAAKNNFLSTREGRAIFDEVIFVEVISPGSKGSTPVFEVERTFAKEMNHPQPLRGMQYDQYAELIERFKSREVADASMTGTPLTEWPEISRTMAASLREANIFSIEALANLPDTALSLVGPDGRSWRTKAAAFLEAAKDAGYATRLAAENEEMRREMAEMREQMAVLAQNAAAAAAAAADTQAAPAPEPVPAPAPAAGGKRTAAKPQAQENDAADGALGAII